jgi:hypothetical protein
MRLVGAGTLLKKNRQFLAKLAGRWYCFSEISIRSAALFMSDARPRLRS